MSWISDYAGWLVPMVVLILLSALFSGSEAALFSLSTRHRRHLARSGPGGRLAARLLDDSEQLLSAILFWNLLINMTYFAIASIVAARLEATEEIGASVAFGFTAVSLLAIIFFSEMLPKSIAVLSPTRTSVLVAIPLNFFVGVVRPILGIVKTANVLASRLLWPSFRGETDIDLSDIERAVELGTDDAALLQRERVALRSLVEIAETRAAELMRPRSKLRLVSLPVDREELLDSFPVGGYAMVTDEQGDKIVGSLGIRMLRPHQFDDVENFVDPVIYVPWAAPVARVLDQLIDEDVSVAVVVDEYGEAIGALSLERIYRRMLAPEQAPFLDTGTESAIRRTSDEASLVNGSLSLRQLAKHLGVAVPDESVATVAGYIQRNNQRLPRPGDHAELEEFTLTVVEELEDDLEIKVTVRPHSDDDVIGGQP
ncbi:MAG: CNNM domain-containing protein [Planctomycetota bacterium]